MKDYANFVDIILRLQKDEMRPDVLHQVVPQKCKQKCTYFILILSNSMVFIYGQNATYAPDSELFKTNDKTDS